MRAMTAWHTRALGGGARLGALLALVAGSSHCAGAPDECSVDCTATLVDIAREPRTPATELATSSVSTAPRVDAAAKAPTEHVRPVDRPSFRWGPLTVTALGGSPHNVVIQRPDKSVALRLSQGDY